MSHLPASRRYSPRHESPIPAARPSQGSDPTNTTLPPLRIPEDFSPYRCHPQPLEPRSYLPSPAAITFSNVTRHQSEGTFYDLTSSAAASSRSRSSSAAIASATIPDAQSRPASSSAQDEGSHKQKPFAGVGPDSPRPMSNPNNQYRLIVRQQPEVARACGFGERDRRVLDPPPILECVGPVGQYLDRNEDEMMGPTFITLASLWNAEGTEDVTMAAQPSRNAVKLLVGSTSTSAAPVRDDQGRKGLFFTFADLSCRTSGQYRLRFHLVQINPAQSHPGNSSPILANVMSDIFVVYSAKDFPGMRKATPLTKALKEQGVPIPAKKSRHGKREE